MSIAGNGEGYIRGYHIYGNEWSPTTGEGSSYKAYASPRIDMLCYDDNLVLHC